MNIGLIRVGGRRWIAGVVYLHNLIRSVNYLDGVNKVDFTLFVKSRFNPDYHKQELKDNCPPINIFNSSKNRSFLQQVYDAIPVITKFKRVSWIEEELKKFDIDIAFPANAILGKYKHPTKLV